MLACYLFMYVTDIFAQSAHHWSVTSTNLTKQLLPPTWGRVFWILSQSVLLRFEVWSLRHNRKSSSSLLSCWPPDTWILALVPSLFKTVCSGLEGRAVCVHQCSPGEVTSCENLRGNYFPHSEQSWAFTVNTKHPENKQRNHWPRGQKQPLSLFSWTDEIQLVMGVACMEVSGTLPGRSGIIRNLP